MAWSRSLRLWTAAVWVLCLLAATGGHPADRSAAAGASAAVGLLSSPADPAVLPARAADEVRAATQSAPTRSPVVVAVLTLLVGLHAVARRQVEPATGGARPLRARRHTITLRAPPLLFA